MWVKENREGNSGPYIHGLYTEPHLCTCYRLMCVQTQYERGYISQALYDRWLSVNGGEYQLGNSPKSMNLWRDVTVPYLRVTESSDHLSHNEATRISKRSYFEGCLDEDMDTW